MDQPILESILFDLDLPAIRFFDRIDSTNNEAWRWIQSGAPHAALVVADEQTSGRGRLQRRWVTAAGSSLAFSLILQSPPLLPELVSRLAGLGAVATCLTLQATYGLPAQVKWPNDVLIHQRKVAGVLVESRWDGEKLQAAVIGIGINIARESVNPVNLPVDGLNFPAVCIEDALGSAVDRLEVLHDTLQALFYWLPGLASEEFLDEWEACLAYREQWVELKAENTASAPHQEATPTSNRMGKLIGLSQDGALIIQTASGELLETQIGEIHLRPSPGAQAS